MLEVCILGVVACSHLEISFQFVSDLRHQEDFSSRMLPSFEDT